MSTLHCVGVEIELDSEEGFIDVNEGILNFTPFETEGFSYGSIPVRMYLFTYSEYAARGFNLTDDFDSDDIPADAVDGLLI